MGTPKQCSILSGFLFLRSYKNRVITAASSNMNGEGKEEAKEQEHLC